MKYIEGIVCTGFQMKMTGQLDFIDGRQTEYLYGPNERNGGFKNIKTNGLRPFLNIDSARVALDELNKSGFDFFHTGLAEIKMRITENDTENALLRNCTQLVVVAVTPEGSFHLLGPHQEGSESFAARSASSLQTTWFNTFRNYDGVVDMFGALYEIRRQGRLESHLGTFQIRFI